MLLPVRRFLPFSLILLATCSSPPFPRQATVPIPREIPACTVTNAAIPPQQVDTVTALRRTAEMGPLFAVPAARAGLAECNINYESGLIALEYRFRDGSWLRVKRDSRIEYNDQELRLASPPAEDPLAILTPPSTLPLAPTVAASIGGRPRRNRLKMSPALWKPYSAATYATARPASAKTQPDELSG